MEKLHPPLSRTSSSTSVYSSDDTVSVITISSSRRTRKRFTNVQLTMLENLFHQNSHPSRDDREAVAKAGGMEIKSVTIWFQNKRQTERKVAANNVANPPSTRPRTSSSPTFPSTRSASTASSSSRPSLDHVASRSELRAPAPRTPNRRQNPNAAIWDNMPSSPLASPNSPQEREYMNFGTNQRTRRTLEWACAAARLADKGSSGSETVRGSSSRGRTRPHDKNDMDLDLTDEEADEAITPPSTWGKGDPRWSAEEIKMGQITEYSGVEDDDMMNAALALCGLGRRTK